MHLLLDYALHSAAPSIVGLVWGGGKVSIPLLFPSYLAEQNWVHGHKQEVWKNVHLFVLCFSNSVAARGNRQLPQPPAGSPLVQNSNQLRPKQHTSGLFTVFTVYTPVDRRTLFTVCAMVDCPSPSHNVGHPYLSPPSSDSMTSSAGPGQPS